MPGMSTSRRTEIRATGRQELQRFGSPLGLNDGVPSADQISLGDLAILEVVVDHQDGGRSAINQRDGHALLPPG